MDTTTVLNLAEGVAIVMGLTQAMKMAKMSSRWAPLVAIVFGLLFAFLSLGFVASSIIPGLVVGLTASGLYGGVKKTVQG